MEIDSERRQARMGLRELAEFALLRTRSGRPSAGLWRMKSGREWHDWIQEEAKQTHLAEKAISGSIERKGWTLLLEGRADLYREDETGLPIEIGEIKTVMEPLPMDALILRERYPSYFRQAAAYAFLLSETLEGNHQPQAAIVFVDIDTGLRQEVPVDVSDHLDLQHQIDGVIDFLETMRERHRARRTIQFTSLLDHPRPGQVEASAQLNEALATASRIGFQAPTGFGKTRLLWETALTYLREERVDRILYLTVKNSGQEQAVIEWERLFPQNTGPRSYRFRNHAEHYSVCPFAGCTPDACLRELPENASGDIEGALYRMSGGPQALWVDVSDLAEKEYLCPYDLSRSLLPLADAWIGDLNYLFSPGSRHLFREQVGFQPERTFLLVDEAHHLPDRVESALSVRLDASSLEDCGEQLKDLRTLPVLRRILRELTRWTRMAAEGETLDATQYYRFLDTLEAVLPILKEERVPWRDLDTRAIRTLQSLTHLYELLDKDDLRPTVWCPRSGSLEGIPLRTAPWILDSLSGFHKAVFFSATLSPFDDYAEQIGVDLMEWKSIIAEDSSKGQFRAAIDTTVDTRLRHRESHYARTAEAAAQIAETSNHCAIVFFPSRKYAEAVRLYMEIESPHLRVAMQPALSSTGETEDFLQNAPARSDLLFLLLGGVFAEGIDALGGVLDKAMIVGPALPELNALTRLKMETYPNREEGFHKVCRIPGMRRVNQAMGRLVRDASHRATILLHDRRFNEPEYRHLLRKDLGDLPLLQTKEEVSQWLSQPSEPGTHCTSN